MIFFLLTWIGETKEYYFILWSLHHALSFIAVFNQLNYSVTDLVQHSR